MSQKKFAYLDQYGIMHLNTQKEASKHGKYIETDLQADESGYPVVNGKGIVYYSREDVAYDDARSPQAAG